MTGLAVTAGLLAELEGREATVRCLDEGTTGCFAAGADLPLIGVMTVFLCVGEDFTVTGGEPRFTT